jgi:hypothetical protein
MNLVNFILRRVIGQLVNRGINAGINHAAGRGKPRAEMTKAERQQAGADKENLKRARQAARIARRMMR